jgi:hypothetical protein
MRDRAGLAETEAARSEFPGGRGMSWTHFGISPPTPA